MVCPTALLPALAGSIIAYSLPSIYSNSSTFNLTANAVQIPVMQYAEYDYAHFSMDNKPTKISIMIPENKPITSIRISPKKLDIKPTFKDNCITFTLPKDEYMIVKVAGLKELVIAADALEKDKPPISGALIYNVRSDEYKANGEGKDFKPTTEAFQKAINNAEKGFIEATKNAAKPVRSRATVYVPKGVYMVGNLVLKNNTELYLEAGAFLRFSGNKTDYTEHWYKSSQGRPVTWWISTEFNTTNIKVYGRGTLDGNGKYGSDKGKINNNILVPIATKNFEADGIIIRESSSWSTIPMRSSDLLFTNIKWFNHLSMSENDGIDPLESQRVTIKHAIAISLDDPFSTKTYTNIFPKYNDKLPSPQSIKDVLFEDCISWTRCFGFKVGQGVFMPHENVTFRNGVVYDAAVGVGINHKWGASYVDRVIFDKIDIERISLWLAGTSSWLAIFTANPKDNANDASGPVRNVEFRSINVMDQGKGPAILEGLNDKANITDLWFDLVMMPNKTKPAVSLSDLNVKETKFVNNIRFEKVN